MTEVLSLKKQFGFENSSSFLSSLLPIYSAAAALFI